MATPTSKRRRITPVGCDDENSISGSPLRQIKSTGDLYPNDVLNNNNNSSSSINDNYGALKSRASAHQLQGIPDQHGGKRTANQMQEESSTNNNTTPQKIRKAFGKSVGKGRDLIKSVKRLTHSVSTSSLSSSITSTVPDSISGAVFCQPLEELTGPGQRVPQIVEIILEFLSSDRLEEEGIYRISGQTSTVARLACEFNKSLGKSSGANIDSAVPDLHKVIDGTHVAAGLLKLFLRELPNKIFSSEAASAFHATMENVSEVERAGVLLTLLHSLPSAHRDTATAILRHWHTVVEFKSSNKMTAESLSIVLAPTLGFKASHASSLAFLIENVEVILAAKSLPIPDCVKSATIASPVNACESNDFDELLNCREASVATVPLVTESVKSIEKKAPAKIPTKVRARAPPPPPPHQSLCEGPLCVQRRLGSAPDWMWYEGRLTRTSLCIFDADVNADTDTPLISIPLRDIESITAGGRDSSIKFGINIKFTSSASDHIDSEWIDTDDCGASSMICKASKKSEMLKWIEAAATCNFASKV